MKPQSRRFFLGQAAAFTVASSVHVSEVRAETPIALVKPTLPFAVDALAPFISSETVDLHFNAHHLGYFNRLVGLTSAQGISITNLDLLVLSTARKPGLTDVSNVAGQVLNHNLYWASLRPAGGTRASDSLLAAIVRDFGGFSKMTDLLTAAASGHFGSGWAWLAMSKTGKLSVITTHDASNPIMLDLVPLLCLDVWEHAYYIDYRNKRPTYVAAVVQHLLNWDFASQQYDSRVG